MNLYTKAESEKEPFYKIQFYKSVLGSSEEFLRKLEYGRILNPIEEEKYSGDREKASSVSAKIELEKQKLNVAVKVQDDYSNIIKTALSSAFSDSGFNVTDDGNYHCNAKIELNQNGENPISIMPGIEVELHGENGKMLFSYSGEAQEKSIAYSIDNAKRKAFPKLAEKTKSDISEKLK